MNYSYYITVQPGATADLAKYSAALATIDILIIDCGPIWTMRHMNNDLEDIKEHAMATLYSNNKVGFVTLGGCIISATGEYITNDIFSLVDPEVDELADFLGASRAN